MPEANEPVPASPDVKASTPQIPADQPTTQTTPETSDSPFKGVMDALDIPAEIQNRISPPVQSAPEPPVEATPPVEPPAEPEPPKVEEPEETKEDADEEDEETEVEQVAAEQPQKIDKRQKRINRLTRQKAELTTQLDSIAAENQKLRQQLGQGKPEDQPAPLVGGNLPKIQEEIAKCDAILAWCDDNAEGGQIGEGEKAQYYEPKDIRSWRRNAEVTRQERVVEKRKELDRLEQVRAQADMEAFRLWPEMFDKTKPEYQEAVSIIQRYPFLVNVPEANLALGQLIEGGKALKAKVAPSNGQKPHRDIDERAFTTPRVPIAPHTPEPPSRESKVSSEKKFNEAMSNLVKDQDNNDKWLADAFSALEEQSRSAVTAKTPVKT